MSEDLALTIVQWIFVFFIVLLNIYKFYEYFGDRIFKQPIHMRNPFLGVERLSANDVQLIKSYVPLYKTLNVKQRESFETRVSHFINNIDFISRNDFKITREVEVLCAATYVSVTFGMIRFLMPYFDKVIIYPDKYFSRVNNEFHLGEYNPQLKAVVFSWEHFKEGIAVENDNMNLGIHEFAHVLYFNSLQNKSAASKRFLSGVEKLKEVLYDDEAMTQVRASGYLREYAFTNEFEFFAVALEYFVESPQDFKTNLPRVFNIITEMLNFEYLQK